MLEIVQSFLNGTAEPYQWGILAGTLVYIGTVMVVIYLLFAGGSFKRMREQAEAYQKHGAKAFQVPLTAKPRLYDNLLEASHTLPEKPQVEGGILKGKGVELVVIDPGSMDQSIIEDLYKSSNGSARYGHGSYDPIERIWRWLPDGPPQEEEEEEEEEEEKEADKTAAGVASFQEILKMRGERSNSVDFYIRDMQSGYIIGMASILNNQPRYLRAEIGDIWVTPAFRGTYAMIETCYLLLYRLFQTLGYRRVEWQCDVDNINGQKVAGRVGFALEGVLRKHMVWRDANRDTALYAMTNSDWRDPAADKIKALLLQQLKKDLGRESKAARSLLDELEEEELEGDVLRVRKDK